MQIKRGSTRVALIALGLVFKFPTLQQHTKRGYVVRFFRGFKANITEFVTYIRCGCPTFMVPVLSLGLVNIQFNAGDRQPRMSDMVNAHLLLSKAAQDMASLSDKHAFGPGNFRWGKNGLRMIDFGNGRRSHYSLSHFLVKHGKEFGEALAKVRPTATAK